MNTDKIVEVVKQAGKFVFDDELKSDVRMKGAADYVTAVDMKISGYVKQRLGELYPEIGFMSEEEKNELVDDRWILDPIDGTTNLVYGYNVSSVSLAHYCNGRVQMGVIYNPFNGELFVAERGKGVTLNGKALKQAPDRDPCDSIIEFGAGSTKKQFTDESFRIGCEVFRECLDLRRMCSSALAIAYVAAGRINGYFERSLKPWDYAAAVLMLEECGGVCSDWRGEALPFDRPSGFVCGTPKTYAYLRRKIDAYSDKE